MESKALSWIRSFGDIGHIKEMLLGGGAFSIIVDIVNHVILVLYWFQAYNIVVRHLYNLWGDHPDKSSTHLTSYTVIAILLTVFPTLYFAFPQLVLLLAICAC